MQKFFSRKFIQSTLIVILAFVLILAGIERDILADFLIFAGTVTGIYHAANVYGKPKANE